MKMTPRQQLINASLAGLDQALETYAEAAVTGSVDDVGTTPPPKPRSHPGSRWKKELTHEQRMEQKLDRIISLLEGLN